jgi:pyridoxal phosphate enzyme (YggS family)
MSLADRLREVQTRIADACRRSSRDPASVQLVAVSKTRSPAECREAVLAGQAILGENYAQELRDKAPLVPEAWWHFIGPLQRNKVKYVVGTAQLIHTIDSVSLAEATSARAEKLGTSQRCLVQVNVAQEPQKAGCAPETVPELLAQIAGMPALRCEGLMCIPPETGDPRPHFDRLRELAEANRLPELSMGMSGDFEAAIAAGATLVRLGTAIFGPRPPKA